MTLNGEHEEVWGDACREPAVSYPNQAIAQIARADGQFRLVRSDEVRALTEFVTPAGEHVLDWFHITMRLTVLTQFIRGVAIHDETKGAELLKSLERIKWLLWHGNLQRTLTVIEDFEEDVDELDVDYPNLRKFVRTAHEFSVYIKSNPDQ